MIKNKSNNQMIEIDKFVIGVMPASRMFRVPSVVGLVIDKILSERGGKMLSDDYYSEVASSNEKNSYKLLNNELGNSLIISLDNIIFTKDFYDKDYAFNYKQVVSEFTCIWQIINEYLKISDIRRIGVLAEHQFNVEPQNSNKKLLDLLTVFAGYRHPAKFHLHFENRHSTPEGLAPDIEKSDYINVIYDVYDSEIDANHSKKGAVNANIDVQRYYSPLLKSNIPEQVSKINTIFQREKDDFESFLNKQGLLP